MIANGLYCEIHANWNKNISSGIKFNKILYYFSFLCLKKIFHTNMLEAGVQNDGGGIWRSTLYSYIENVVMSQILNKFIIEF